MAKNTKTGGRKPGTPNRLTSELRIILKDIVADELEKLPEILDKLDVKDRVEATIKLMAFVLPKVEAVNLTEGEPWDSILHI